MGCDEATPASKYGVRLNFRPRDVCRGHDFGRNTQRGCVGGVAPLSVRRITEIHAAVGRKLVALSADGVAPLSVRRITETTLAEMVYTQTAAMARTNPQSRFRWPWLKRTPCPPENLSELGKRLFVASLRSPSRPFSGIPNQNKFLFSKRDVCHSA